MHIIRELAHKLTVTALALFVVSAASAQNDDATNTYTPYSFYGVGDLASPGVASNLGMGGIGTGLRSSYSINFMNPAALTAQDSLSFMFDFGVENYNFYSVYFSNDGTEHRSASNSLNVHHVVFSFPVYKKFVVGVGLLPYSNVGYKVERRETNPKIIADMGNVYYRYRGEGGISQIALSLGAGIGDRISLGGQIQYYFGTIDRYSNVDFASNNSYSDLVSGTSLKVGNVGFILGAQYEQPLENDLSLTIGATYQFSTKIGRNLEDFAYSNIAGVIADTIRMESRTNNLMSIPMTISGGFSLTKKDKWTAGLDYVYQDWRNSGFDAISTTHNFKVIPSHLVRAGFEWTPARHDFRNYLNRCSYRIGVSYERTYMQFSDNQINDMSATVGLGIPVNRWNNALNFSAEVGRRGTTNHGLIREIYVKFSVSFSIYDIWFHKQKIE
jgi:hypothetical protein